MPKKYNVILTASAEDDINEIWNYIASDSRDNAVNFISEIESLVQTLTKFPKRESIITESDIFKVEYKQLIYDKYRIVFRIQQTTVFVLRVIHSAKLLEL